MALPHRSLPLLLAVLIGAPAAAKPGRRSAEANPPATPSEGAALAVVNGHPITEAEWAAAAARKQPKEGDTLSAAERQAVLDALIADRLLYEEALAAGLDKDPKVQKVMINELLRREVYDQVQNASFTDRELERYYEAHKDEFVVPEKAQLGTILVRVSETRAEPEARALANAIRDELRADPDRFRELASRHSEDPYKRRGGDVGFVSAAGKPGLDPKIVTIGLAQETEQISEPARIDAGYVIVRTGPKREAVERTFEQMKGSVLRKMKNERLQVLYDKHVAHLKRDATVQVDRAALERAPVPPPTPIAPGLTPSEAPAPSLDEIMGEEEGEDAEAEPIAP